MATKKIRVTLHAEELRLLAAAKEFCRLTGHDREGNPIAHRDSQEEAKAAFVALIAAGRDNVDGNWVYDIKTKEV